MLRTLPCEFVPANAGDTRSACGKPNAAAHRAPDGDPGRAELLHEVGLAGQPPTRDDAPGHDLPEKRFIDLAVLRRRNDGS